MLTSASVFHFSPPATPSEGAWCLAVILIARANLRVPSTYETALDTVFDLSANSLAPNLKRESILLLTSFKFSTFVLDEDVPEYFDEMGPFTSMLLFSVVEFDGGYPGSIKVSLQASALPFLRQLQRGIHELLQQDALSPTALITHMQNSAPLTVLELPGAPPYQLGFFDRFIYRLGLPQRWASAHEAQNTQQQALPSRKVLRSLPRP